MKMRISSFVLSGLFIVLFLSLHRPAFSQSDTIWLSDMKFSSVNQQYGQPEMNRSADGTPLQIAGNAISCGVGVHASSKITVALQKKPILFRCLIGISDKTVRYTDKSVSAIPLTDGAMLFYQGEKDPKQFVGVGDGSRTVQPGSVRFRVIADGKEIYNSGVVKGGEKPRLLELPIESADRLVLQADDGGDGSSGDHAVWGEACFIPLKTSGVANEGSAGKKTPDVNLTGLLPDRVGDVISAIQQEKTDSLLRQKAALLPVVPLRTDRPQKDWLIDPSGVKAMLGRSENGKDLVLTNGLISRVFRITPNVATVDFINQMTGESLLRAVSNEGVLTIEGQEYPLGGLDGQPEFGYTQYKWVDSMTVNPASFRVTDFTVSELDPRLKWANRRWALERNWNQTGKVLTFSLSGPGEWSRLNVKIHYALYDGLPVISKWMEVDNQTGRPVRLDRFVLEQLAMAETESPVEALRPEQFIKPNIHIESDWAFHGFTERESEQTEFWLTDARYTSQCNYPMVTPCLLEVKLPMGPDVTLADNDTFSTFRTWLMPFDSDDRERKGLFVKRMYRRIAPWTTENPIFMHCTSSRPEVVREAIDQCAATGYEMVILSFGSGLNMEDERPENIAKFKELREYATSRGIELGAYSLLSSRWISDEVDVINPETGKRGGMIFGSSPCLSSEWGYEYFRKIRSFYEKTGMTAFENDGSYPGNVCASEKHAHHRGLLDSQWEQRKQIEALYSWMCQQGIYTNVPDYGYVLNGTNKVGIGYREVNWSLPRERQLVLGRQVIYDGLWERLPGMCWSFVPLTQYHGGGAAATLEPLHEHLDAYQAHMMQNYGSGIQACYRGYRLYDTDETRKMVTDVIGWYKRYRDILNSELLHLRRPDGKDYDAVMHVNPSLKERALVMVYNPTDEEISRTIQLPLYYTGLVNTARVREQEGRLRKYKLNRNYEAEVTVTLPAKGYTWLVVEP